MRASWKRKGVCTAAELGEYRLDGPSGGIGMSGAIGVALPAWGSWMQGKCRGAGCPWENRQSQMMEGLACHAVGQGSEGPHPGGMVAVERMPQTN